MIKSYPCPRLALSKVENYNYQIHGEVSYY